MMKASIEGARLLVAIGNAPPGCRLVQEDPPSLALPAGRRDQQPETYRRPDCRGRPERGITNAQIRPGAVIAGNARPRFRAAGSDSIAAVCRGVAHICTSSLPHPRALHWPVARRCGRCRMPGEAASAPKPSQHRRTNSIGASRGKDSLTRSPSRSPGSARTSGYEADHLLRVG
jgi:hypothetical protein